MATHTFETPEALQDWGRRLARRLKRGDFVALIGELGAGKTTLVQGIAAGWGSKQPANSPTFALVNEYHSRRGSLQHMDMYRLTPRELEAFPLEDYLHPATVTVVEWADRIHARWPAKTLQIRFKIIDPSTRQVTVSRPVRKTHHNDPFEQVRR